MKSVEMVTNALTTNKTDVTSIMPCPPKNSRCTILGSLPPTSGSWCRGGLVRHRQVDLSGRGSGTREAQDSTTRGRGVLSSTDSRDMVGISCRDSGSKGNGTWEDLGTSPNPGVNMSTTVCRVDSVCSETRVIRISPASPGRAGSNPKKKHKKWWFTK